MTPSRKPARTQSQAKRAETSSRGGKCPICGKPRSADYSPFCSKRCADIDLNRWLSGRYAVPGEPAGSVVPGDKDEED